ncbi:unannotated protein [freshwater metagenome]|uniref:Unannotated protein n=1 Tax=freshwater metagenome TaxID=449393 RepID=A0A6J7L398_9ZZZZ
MFASKMPFSSDTFVLPRTIAPAASSLATSAASFVAFESCRATEPPVVGRPSASMTSERRIGRPSRRRRCPALRAASDALACSIASGFSERTAWIAGPSALTRAIRCR